MESLKYDIGTQVTMKKNHPCGANSWEVVRLGADVKIKCLNCGHMVMIPRVEFNKKIKKILNKKEESNE